MAEGDMWESKENLENIKELVEEFEREYREEAKELRQQKQEEKKKNLVGNYLGNLWQNYYMDGKGKGIKGRERRDGMKIGINGRIPWDKKP